MFGNRLAKNLKHLRSWAQREEVTCYRLYDADMPEYAFAIDRYRTIEPDEQWLYVQEYAAPAEIELEAVRKRRGEVLATLPEALGVPAERIRVRTRRRTKRGEQYEKVDEQAHFHRVLEGGLKFRVNFEDYLDTGIFLDHRLTRARLRERARGGHFLNLFAYTGTATVYAAAGGAASTTTVDLSRTYLDWAQRNLSINELQRQRASVPADRLPRMAQASRARAASATISCFWIRRRSRTPSAWRACWTSSGTTRNSSPTAPRCWLPAVWWCFPPTRSAFASMKRSRSALMSVMFLPPRCRRTLSVTRASTDATS